MKKSIVLAMTGSLLLSGTAMADWVINVPDFAVGNAGSPHPSQFVHTVTLGSGADIIGMSFEAGGWVTTGGAFGSDLFITVTDPDGGTTTFGGYNTLSDNPWLVSNPGSSWTGAETWPLSFAPGTTRPGEWTFTFTYDWAGGGSAGVSYTDVVITLHKIPAPGAFALLGIAGLAGVSRRRRS